MNNHEEEREQILKAPLPVTLQECIDQRLVFHTSSALEQYRRLKIHEVALLRLEEKLKERERLFKKLGLDITIHSINLYPAWEDQEEPVIQMSFEFTFHGKLIRYIRYVSPESHVTLKHHKGGALTEEQELELEGVLNILNANRMELYNNFN